MSTDGIRRRKEMNTYQNLLADMTAIVEDFENYGGDVVMLLASLDRIPRARSNPYHSTRRRIRERTERDMWRFKLASAMYATQDSEERVAKLVPVMGRLVAALGHNWLADSPDTYYTEVMPLPDPVAQVECLLAVAAKGVSRALESAIVEADVIAKVQCVEERWAAEGRLS